MSNWSWKSFARVTSGPVRRSWVGDSGWSPNPLRAHPQILTRLIPAISLHCLVPPLKGNCSGVREETGVPACQCVIPDRSHIASQLMGKSKLKTLASICVRLWKRELVPNIPGQLVLDPREDTISSGTFKRLLMLALEVLLSDTVCECLTQSALVDTWKYMPPSTSKTAREERFIS